MIRAVTSKDLKVLWSSPLPWVVGALLHAVLGLLYVNELAARGQALVQPLVPLAGFLVLALLPVLTMRAFAEERRQGTLDLLLASPVPPSVLVLGKWAAVWLTTMAVLLPSLAVVAVVARLGDPDPGPVVSGSLGLALFSAAAAGVGVLASACTSSPPVAAVVTFFGSLVLWFSHVGSESFATGVLVRLSWSERLRTFAAGGVDSGDVAMFAAVTVVALALAGMAVARRPTRLAAAVAALAVVLAVVADVRPVQRDLTADATLTLSPETKEVLDALRKPVRITAFLDRADPTRVAAPTLLSRYRRQNHRVSFRVREPASGAGEARRLGVDPTFGGLALESGDRVELAPAATEQDITAALARLLRGGAAELCASTGHGEADVASSGLEGLSRAASLLAANRYELRPIDLLTSPSVPASCDALLVASPMAPLGAASAAVSAYLDGGGRAVVLLDPASPEELAELLTPYGIAVRRGLVLEGEPENRFREDPLRPVVRDYRGGTSIVRRLPPTFFPAVQAVVVDTEADREGLAVTPLAATSRLSFLETTPQQLSFDPATDLPGPVTVAAAADLSRNTGGNVQRTRLVVVGDVDFATNAFVDEAANGQLLVRAVDWITEEESLVTVSANLGRVRPLALTEGRLRYLRLLSSGILPALFLVLGGLVWAVRRGR